jgi:Sec-independent protein translocase protein TatA
MGQGIKNFKQGLKEANELDEDKKEKPAVVTDDKEAKPKQA